MNTFIIEMRPHRIRFSFILIILFAFGQRGFCQGDYYLAPKQYSFINYDTNRLILPQNSAAFNELFSLTDSMILKGKGNIHIMHFGGSHIQADIYSHLTRKRLQQLAGGLTGSRGFVFPYRIAGTNNPSNYKVKYTGKWSSCKSSSNRSTCDLGISGYQVETSDSVAEIKIYLNADSTIKYAFNKVQVFHNSSDYQLLMVTGEDSVFGVQDTTKSVSTFELPYEFSDTVEFQFRRKSDSTLPFRLYGFNFLNDNIGYTYSSLGVNGAALKHYLKCNLYEQQLSVVKPDVLIFSIGTNDGNTRSMNKERYREQYSELIDRSLKAVPDAKLIITVPNDCYYYRRYPNKNTAVMQSVIFDLAKKYNAAVWDFYTIMGGFNASQAWYHSELMQYDRIHFNKKGYLLKGELFFSAFLKAWEKERTETIQSKQ